MGRKQNKSRDMVFNVFLSDFGPMYDAPQKLMAAYARTASFPEGSRERQFATLVERLLNNRATRRFLLGGYSAVTNFRDWQLQDFYKSNQEVLSGKKRDEIVECFRNYKRGVPARLGVIMGSRRWPQKKDA